MTWADLCPPLDMLPAQVASTFKLQHLSPQYYSEEKLDLLSDLEL